MTSHSHKSPNAAIREWLWRAVDETVEQPGLEVAQNNESEKPAWKVKHKVRRKKDRIHQNCPHSSTYPRPKQGINYEKAHVSSGPAAHFQAGPRLADRLSLRAPFRNFPTQGRQSKARPSKLDRERKRKLSTSSSSSYLERAVFPETEDLSSSPKPGSALGLRRPKCQQNLHSNITDSSMSNAVIGPLRRPKESYERKKRHKTREDRYELKQDKKDRKETEARKKTANKKKEKHKRRAVSGTALMQDFSAKNVAPDRLTLQKAAGVGLFNKGRASSPIRRKGLPGLTFSEMQFHSQGRRKPEEFSCRTNKQNKHPRRRQEKEAGVDEKISRYFSNEKASGINPCLKLGGKAGAITDRQEQRLCDQNSSSRPPVDLPDRPFLGFGSRGPNVSSPLCYHHDLPPSDIIANMSKRMTPTSTTYYAWSQTDTAQLAEDNTPPERSAVQEQNLIRVEPSPIRRTRVSDRSTKKVTHNSVSPSYQDASECVKEPQKAGVSKPQSKSEPPQEWTDGHLSGSGSREQAVQTENVIIMESTMDNSIDVQPLRVIHDQLQEADATEMETSRIVTPDFTKRNPINSLLDMFLRLREDKVTGSVQVRQQCRQRHLNSKSLSPKDTPSKTQPQARGNTAESFHQLAPWMERKPQRSTGPTHFSSLPQESNTPATVAPFSFPQAELRYLKQQQTSTQRERQCFGFENPNMSSTQYLASSHTQVGCDNLFERQQNQGMMAWPSGNANLIGGSSFHATREPKAYDISINDIDLFDHDKEYDQIDGENQNGSELLEVQYEAEDYADHNYSSEFQLHENPWHSATHCPNSGQELEHLSEQEDCSAHRKPHEERLHMDNDSSQALPSPSTTDRSKPLEGFIGQRRLPHLSNELPPSPLSAISRPWTRESDYRIRGSSSLRDGQVSKDKSLAGFWKPNRLY